MHNVRFIFFLVQSADISVYQYVIIDIVIVIFTIVVAVLFSKFPRGPEYRCIITLSLFVNFQGRYVI